MTKQKWFTGVAVLAATALTLVGCGSNTSSTSTPNSQTLNVAISAEPPALDPSRTTANASFTLMNYTNEGLYRLDAKNQPQPAVAAALPTITNGGKTYTIKLRPDAKWSDGSVITAQDFVYSIQRTLDPKTASQYAFMPAKWIVGADAFNKGKTKDFSTVGVKAIDDHTVQFNLIQPVTFFTSQLAFPVFFPEKQAFVDKVGASNYGADANKLLYNGPFVMTSWNHEQDITLKKNANYWDTKDVHLDSVTFQIVKDQTTAMNLYQTNGVDITMVARDQITQYKGKPDLVYNPQLTNAYLEYNTTLKGLDNPRIRQAFTEAIDKKAMVDATMGNGSTPANGIVPVGTADGNGGEFRKDAGSTEAIYDPVEAKQLLATGLKEAGMTQLPKFTIIGDNTDTSKQQLEFVQAQLKQNLGVDVDVQPITHSIRLQKQASHNFQISLALWGADYNDPMTFLDMWESTSPFNDTQWKNPQYDALVNAAQAEANGAKRAQDLVAAEKLAMQEAPISPLYFRTQAYLVRPTVKGLYFPTAGCPEYEIKDVTIN